MTTQQAERARSGRMTAAERREQLLDVTESMVEREGARALVQLAAVLPSDLRQGDPRDSLLAALRGYLSAAQADPVTWRLVLMPPEGAPDLLREHITRGR